jgi:hypothetical protein
MTLMALLLAAGGCWFLYDGVVGYGKKNVTAIAEMAFHAGGEGAPWVAYTEGSTEIDDSNADEATMGIFREAHTAGGQKTPWSDHALRNKYSEDGSGEPKVFEAFKAGGVIGANWPDYASLKSIPVDPKDDGQVSIKRAYEAAGKKREWATYALTKNWGSGEIKYHTTGQIREQKFIAGALLAGAFLVLATFFLNRGRKISADADSYTDEKGARIAFTDIFRIDRRKWDNKGLAYAFYRSGASEKKAIIDDLKYIGAGEILARMLENFQGELIDRAKDDEDDEDAENEAIESNPSKN